MRAWQIVGDFGLKNLRLSELSLKPLKSHQVRVKIHACSLNYRDLMVIKGLYNPKQALPLIPLSDGAGEVIEVGTDVTNFKVKDRVCATFSQKWCHGVVSDESLRNTLGSPLEGMLAEQGI